MESAEFELKFVRAVSDFMESKGFKHKPTVEAAWPNNKAACRRWAAMRNGIALSAPDKKQRLRLGDAVLLCAHIGLDIGKLCEKIFYGQDVTIKSHEKKVETSTNTNVKDVDKKLLDLTNALSAAMERIKLLERENAGLEGQLKSSEKMIEKLLELYKK